MAVNYARTMKNRHVLQLKITLTTWPFFHEVVDDTVCRFERMSNLSEALEQNSWADTVNYEDDRTFTKELESINKSSFKTYFKWF